MDDNDILIVSGLVSLALLAAGAWFVYTYAPDFMAWLLSEVR